MKKTLYFITTILLSVMALSLSSCLKDSKFVDFSKAGNIVEFPLGGKINFAADAITASGDTVGRKFAVNVASNHPPATATKITLSVNDPAIITAYNASDPSVSYLPFPPNSYSLTSTVITVPGGQRIGYDSLTVFKKLLDPSLSYMLPIQIKDASGINISGNKGIHYYHIIGNDFAGAYKWDFTRYNTSDGSGAPSGASFSGSDATLSPVTPTQFEAPTGYYTQKVKYEVTFTKTGNGAAAMYSNFAVTLDPATVASEYTANGISVTSPPVIVGYDPAKSYTLAEAMKLFTFQYTVYNGTAYRYNIDKFYKP